MATTTKDALVCTYRPLTYVVLIIYVQWNSGHDESVEVNQRALIDKVLARYSGEFTGVFRALVSTETDALNSSV